MPIFPYKFTHSAGFGVGEFEAHNSKLAINELIAKLTPTDKDVEKLEDLKIEVTELQAPAIEE